MPLYRCAIREGLSNEAQREQIAKEIVRIHCGVTGAPPSFVHAFFQERPASQLPESQAAFVLGNLALEAGLRPCVGLDFLQFLQLYLLLL